MTPSASGPPTRPTLLRRIRNRQDHEAWTSFVTIYTPLIYGHCRKRGLQEEDARDVTQEVFVKVWKFEYQPEKGRFRSWLGTVTWRAIRRKQRQRREVNGRGTVEGEDLLDQETARQEESALEADINRYLFETALARVRPHFADPTWRAFELAWCQDRPAAEVAHELGIPIDHVYVAKHRVLKRLREEIEHLAEDTDWGSTSSR
jgi:RNA polymerase sigma-70 factor (ECF subfamily)